MKAELYENLIRTIYQCERDYKRGADASIYREMEHAFSDLTEKSMFTTDERRDYEYQKTFAAVRNNVNSALRTKIEDMRGYSAKEQIGYLENIESELKWNFYDKDRMDNIISELSDILCNKRIAD